MSATLHFLNAKLFLCLLVTIFQHSSAFATSKPANGLTIRAVLDDSPGSPMHRIENLTIAKRIEKMIKTSYIRANYLDLVSRPNARVVPDNIRIPIIRDDLFYAVVFTMGSQHHLVKLLMDTGSGLTWTQCLPCKNCFPQKLPIYDPKASTTYGVIPCDHPVCNIGGIYSCEDGNCVYTAGYNGGTFTHGVASLDSFQFYINDSDTRSFSNVIFGCSNDTYDFVLDNRDISGIFGLSMRPDSMASQFGSLIHNRFSYCLVPFQEVIPRPIILWFGEDIPRPPGKVQTTLFSYSRPGSYYYNLELLDISVADHRIGFDPGTFNVRPDGSGGCVIDSGALISQIDVNSDFQGVSAYQTVLAVFEAYYGSRNLQRSPGPTGFDQCYKIPKDYHDFAAITFHFNGADYKVDGQYGHYFDHENGVFCVAILRGKFATILGAWHQQNKRIVYDAGIGALQFGDEECINEP